MRVLGEPLLFWSDNFSETGESGGRTDQWWSKETNRLYSGEKRRRKKMADRCAQILKGAMGNQRGWKRGGAQPSETRIRMTNLNLGYKVRWVGELREAVVIWNARRSNHLNALKTVGPCQFSFLICKYFFQTKSLLLSLTRWYPFA